MAVNVKMGVDLGGFKTGIQQGTQILKGLNAEMKATEAEFKATGNAEQKMASQTKNLNSQIQVQKGIIDQAQKALDAMTKAGIDPADKAYQQMYATMMKAQQGMYEAQAALNGLGESAQEAANGANDLVSSVNSIGKKISLDQVISGINTITGALETAAGKALQLGETIWNAVMDRAKWADDTATMALMYGIDLDTFQRMQKLVTNGMDTSVDAILNAQSRLKKNIGSESKTAIDALKELGVAWDEVVGAGKYGDVTKVRDTMEVFWEAGEKILAMKDDPNAQESMAQALFGRNWKELVPLFSSYKSVEEYNNALSQVNVSSEEDVQALADLNDKVGELKGNLDTLSTDILAQLAPALTEAANALNGVLTEIIAYLKTEDGQAMLKSLSDSVSSLFEDIGKIDPASAVESFTTVFNGLISGLQWIVDNKDTLVTALEVVVAGWAGLKITGGVLTIVKLIEGLQGLGILGGGAKAATKAAANGAVNGAQSVGETYGLLDKLVEGQATSFAIDYTTNQFDLTKQREEYIKKIVSDYGLDMKNSEVFKAATDAIFQKAIYSNEDYLQLPEGFLEQLEDLKVTLDPQVPDDAAAQIANQVGTVTVPVSLVWDRTIGGAGGGRDWNVWMKHANGLPFVPYDGYLAYLHRGERVMPAQQNKNYTYNSNNYFGNVNLNNGQDIDALCERIDQRNRRQMSGFGA